MNGGFPSLGTVGEARTDHPEQDLWIAVLHLAIADALAIPEAVTGTWRAGRHAHQRQQHRRGALAWIFCDNPDFQLACALADVDPDFVRTLARRAMKEAA